MAETPENLYRQLRGLLAERPPIAGGALSAEAYTWLGRTTAIIDAAGNVLDVAQARAISDSLAISTNPLHIKRLDMILHRTLAELEFKSPAEVRGGFIPVGGEFTALQAVTKALQTAERDLLLVDPYMSVEALFEYLPLARAGLAVRLLLDGRSAGLNAGIKTGLERWKNQFGDAITVSARVSAPRSLHDRLLIADGNHTYLVSQSLKDLGNRSPASLQKADAEIHVAKREAYETYWANAPEL